mmetsp:Transcript_39689/g.89983  ORF Transcript_39689/g.89983 Transcript_39689/m.89983 type:complete len:205 (-) Transcript_39689:1380-1994(-)
MYCRQLSALRKRMNRLDGGGISRASWRSCVERSSNMIDCKLIDNEPPWGRHAVATCMTRPFASPHCRPPHSLTPPPLSSTPTPHPSIIGKLVANGEQGCPTRRGETGMRKHRRRSLARIGLSSRQGSCGDRARRMVEVNPLVLHHEDLEVLEVYLSVTAVHNEHLVDLSLRVGALSSLPDVLLGNVAVAVSIEDGECRHRRHLV